MKQTRSGEYAGGFPVGMEAFHSLADPREGKGKRDYFGDELFIALVAKTGGRASTISNTLPNPGRLGCAASSSCPMAPCTGKLRRSSPTMWSPWELIVSDKTFPYSPMLISKGRLQTKGVETVW